MVSSGLRKDVWAKRGFLETLQYAEDDEYTRWCRSQGYGVVYCPQSVVMHSHNYSPEQAYKRSFGDARAIAATRPLKPSETAWVRAQVLGWMRDLQKDLSYCIRSRRLRELPFAARIRWNQRKGKWDGLKAGALRFAQEMQ
jgi:rhamnosyltransferase